MPRLGMVGRFGVFTVALVAVCTSVFAFLVQQSQRRSAREHWMAQVEHLGTLVSVLGGPHRIEAGEGDEVIRTVFGTLSKQGARYLVVLDRNAAPLLSYTGGTADVPPLDGAPATVTARTVVSRPTGERVFEVLSPVFSPPGDGVGRSVAVDRTPVGWVQVGIRPRAVKGGTLFGLVDVWFLPLLATGLSGVLVILGSRRPRQRLDALVAAMARRSAGDLSGRIDDDGSDEIAELARTLNLLVDRLVEAENAVRDVRWTLEEKAHERTLRLERAVEQALDQVRAAEEAARSNGYLLLSVAGEIQSLANGLLAVLMRIRDTGRSGDADGAMASAIMSARHLLQVAEDCVVMGEGNGAGVPVANEVFDVVDVTERVVAFHAASVRGKGVEFKMVSDPSLPSRLKGDAPRWRRVVSNLLSNAVKFTERGNILLRLTSNHRDRHGVTVRLEVKDTGTGIPFSARDQVFEAFHRGDWHGGKEPAGQGLGLAIVKQFVDLMGGKVGLSSQPGEGSLFWVELPLGVPADGREGVDEAALSMEGMALVVVEDQETRDHLVAHLQAWGLEAAPANTLEAVPALVFGQTRGGKLALVVVDGVLLESERDPAYYLDEQWFSSGRRVVVLGDPRGLPRAGLKAHEVQVVSKPVRVRRLRRALASLLLPGPCFEQDGPCDEVTSPGGAANASCNAVQPPGTRAKRVLLVADDPTVLDAIIPQLEQMGGSVDVSRNGQQAVESFLRNRYDLVFMDTRLPGMSGFEAARAIRRVESVQHAGRQTPIVALTEGMDSDHLRACSAAGMTDMLTRPVTEEALKEALARWEELERMEEAGGEGEEALFPTVSLTAEGEAVLDGSHQASGDEEGPAIRKKTLGRLRALQRPGKPDIVATVVGYYLEDAPAMVGALEQAMAASNSEAVCGAAHRLKSGSANVGAVRLATLCRRLENLGRRGDVSKMGDIVTQVKEEFGRVESALTDCVSGQGGGQ